ncbi:hypothetical protein P154DRAFT_579093 [Amniculicola lignicola CBS 123094]|uniref:Uncharacterized protein n=1 Tax=Amniculicola lignicola CBS 123094 TaxID=1392246 RepID=A0A6A5W751_9PLEO|nr:hypothetical protein P154DRAFT_579093 [Amniculicola lignicola CBS 123094]
MYSVYDSSNNKVDAFVEKVAPVSQADKPGYNPRKHGLIYLAPDHNGGFSFEFGVTSNQYRNERSYAAPTPKPPTQNKPVNFIPPDPLGHYFKTRELEAANGRLGSVSGNQMQLGIKEPAPAAGVKRKASSDLSRATSQAPASSKEGNGDTSFLKRRKMPEYALGPGATIKGGILPSDTNTQDNRGGRRPQTYMWGTSKLRRGFRGAQSTMSSIWNGNLPSFGLPAFGVTVEDEPIGTGWMIF